MKRLPYILIVICLSFYVYKSFNQDIPYKRTNSNFKVIVNFEEDVISDITLFSTLDAVQNKNIRELLTNISEEIFLDSYGFTECQNPNIDI